MRSRVLLVVLLLASLVVPKGPAAAAPPIRVIRSKSAGSLAPPKRASWPVNHSETDSVVFASAGT